MKKVNKAKKQNPIKSLSSPPKRKITLEEQAKLTHNLKDAERKLIAKLTFEYLESGKTIEELPGAPEAIYEVTPARY